MNYYVNQFKNLIKFYKFLPKDFEIENIFRYRNFEIFKNMRHEECYSKCFLNTNCNAYRHISINDSCELYQKSDYKNNVTITCDPNKIIYCEQMSEKNCKYFLGFKSLIPLREISNQKLQ